MSIYISVIGFFPAHRGSKPPKKGENVFGRVLDHAAGVLRQNAVGQQPQLGQNPGIPQ